MNKADNALKLFYQWYNGLKPQKPNEGPARGTIAAALVVLDKMQSNFSLNLDDYRASGKGQLKGVSASAVSKILIKFGEERPFSKEGGRTNRGAPGDIEKMFEALKKAGLEGLGRKERNRILESMQQFLVEKVLEYHSRQKLKLVFDSNKTLWESVRELLFIAKKKGKDGPVAQYLVGAKLQRRFPSIQVENDSYSTADDPRGRQGDFLIEDTVFHITVNPMPDVFKKCARNIEEGLRVYLIVPDCKISGARQIADSYGISEKITVTSIEAFVSQNIDEISSFSGKKLPGEFGVLLETYNHRVDAIETDKSLMIEIPKNLQGNS